jgi:hypothetical protein
MSRLKVGIFRYASVADAIGHAFGIEPVPHCGIGHGRITLTLRQIGASRWTESRQVEHASRAAAVARRILSEDRRRAVSQRATSV